MNFKFKDFFVFNKEQRAGLVILVSIIIIVQILYFYIDFSLPTTLTQQDQKWLSMQTEIDSAAVVSDEMSNKIYPFNPNFITDFKGYKLGMTPQEIDRLLAFRKTNRYVNSPLEFQKITHISDSLLKAISPYFKFPEWVNTKKEYQTFEKIEYPKKEKTVILDINQASKEDLMKVYGVGEGFSERILKQKETLGAFVSMEQMQDIWGLPPEVIAQLNTHFKIISAPTVKKININSASIKELMKFTYFRYPLAKEIVIYRSMNNGIKTFEDLTKIKDFPVDKIKIIALYLEF